MATHPAFQSVTRDVGAYGTVLVHRSAPVWIVEYGPLDGVRQLLVRLPVGGVGAEGPRSVERRQPAVVRIVVGLRPSRRDCGGGGRG